MRPVRRTKRLYAPPWMQWNTRERGRLDKSTERKLTKNHEPIYAVITNENEWNRKIDACKRPQRNCKIMAHSELSEGNGRWNQVAKSQRLFSVDERGSKREMGLEGKNQNKVRHTRSERQYQWLWTPQCQTKTKYAWVMTGSTRRVSSRMCKTMSKKKWAVVRHYSGVNESRGGENALPEIGDRHIPKKKKAWGGFSRKESRCQWLRTRQWSDYLSGRKRWAIHWVVWVAVVVE